MTYLYAYESACRIRSRRNPTGRFALTLFSFARLWSSFLAKFSKWDGMLTSSTTCDIFTILLGVPMLRKWGFPKVNEVPGQKLSASCREMQRERSRKLVAAIGVADRFMCLPTRDACVPARPGTREREREACSDTSVVYVEHELRLDAENPRILECHQIAVFSKVRLKVCRQDSESV